MILQSNARSRPIKNDLIISGREAILYADHKARRAACASRAKDIQMLPLRMRFCDNVHGV